MTKQDWIDIMNSDNSDIHFVMGQREAALLMLVVITQNWNKAQREECIQKAMLAYETHLKNSGREGFVLSLSPGFRHLCELFRKNQIFDD